MEGTAFQNIRKSFYPPAFIDNAHTVSVSVKSFRRRFHGFPAQTLSSGLEVIESQEIMKSIIFNHIRLIVLDHKGMKTTMEPYINSKYVH